MTNMTLPLILLLPSVLSQALASDCVPTAHRTTGTHYEPVTEQQINVGKGVMVSGRVLVAPDCTPVVNAKVAHWQAGEDGRYRDSLRAYLYTDDNGQFRFETEWPALEPPHIHFIVSKYNLPTLETQWIGNHRVNKIIFDIILEK